MIAAPEGCGDPAELGDADCHCVLEAAQGELEDARVVGRVGVFDHAGEDQEAVVGVKVEVAQFVACYHHGLGVAAPETGLHAEA